MNQREMFVKAFEMWEKEFRDDPSRFMTSEEMAALEVASLSEGRAGCFEAIIRKLQGASDAY